MSNVINEQATGHAHHDHHHPAKGFKRWLYTTNHKDIGSLYLIFSLTMFLIGGAMAMVIRAELFQPGLQLVDPHFFNTRRYCGAGRPRLQHLRDGPALRFTSKFGAVVEGGRRDPP